MKEKLKKFWEPMTEEFNKQHFIMNFIGTLGFIPAQILSQKADSFVLFVIILISWWATVVFIYLTYRYLKNKQQ